MIGYEPLPLISAWANSARMDIDLSALRRQLESDADRYVANYLPPEGTFGTPWSGAKVAAEVAELRRCLIEPYWIDVDIQDPPDNHMGPYRRYPCIAVAEVQGDYLMVFMPHRDEYLLLWRRADGWKSSGVDGDAVGTFLAR